MSNFVFICSFKSILLALMISMMMSACSGTENGEHSQDKEVIGVLLTGDGSNILTLDFGDTTEASSREKVVRISNPGDDTFTNLQAAISDSRFQFKEGQYPGVGGTCGISLAPRSDCTLVISYKGIQKLTFFLNKSVANTESSEITAQITISYLQTGISKSNRFDLRVKGVRETQDLKIEVRELSPQSIATTEFDVSWFPPENITDLQGYKIVSYDSNTGVADCTSNDAVDLERTATRLHITGKVPSTNYIIQVCTVRLAANGSRTVTKGLKTKVTTMDSKPGDPTNFAATQNPGEAFVSLTWNHAPGARSYVVSFGQLGVLDPVCFGPNTKSVEGTNLRIADLELNKRYTFRICSVNSNPEHSTGITTDVFLNNPLPGAVKHLNIETVSPTSVIVNWTAVEEAAKYAILVKPYGVEFEGCSLYSSIQTTLPSATITGLIPGLNYQLRIYSMNNDSIPGVNCNQYASASFATPFDENPAMPIQNLQLESNASSYVAGAPKNYTFLGHGRAALYYYTTHSIDGGGGWAAPQNCTNATAKPLPLGRYIGVGGQRASLNGLYSGSAGLDGGSFAVGKSWGVRICFKRPDGSFDQGKTITCRYDYRIYVREVADCYIN